MTLYEENNTFEIVAETTRINRKLALLEICKTAKIWGTNHATHMLEVLMYIDVISPSAYTSINKFLRKQYKQGWY